MKKDNSKLIERYQATKPTLKLLDRYFTIFEFRYGIADGAMHTQEETGNKFGISGNRVGQIEARVRWEIDKLFNGTRNHQ